MDIIVFGTGQVAQRAVEYLKNQYRILFFVDNDEKKKDTLVGDYIVKSPSEIPQDHCDIVIASTKYAAEIAKQLERMEICPDRIYYFRELEQDNIRIHEIYPFMEEHLSKKEIPLAQYDLYGEEEADTNRIKVLIGCTFYSVYTKQLIENMSKRYNTIEFSLLTRAKENQKEITAEALKHIYYFQTMADLKTILEQLPVYDAMQLLWIEWEWMYFGRLLKEKTGRLNLNVGGSDFYRSGSAEKNAMREIIGMADCITAETEGTVREFSACFAKETQNKMGLLPFGVEVLDFIRDREMLSPQSMKTKFGIPADKIVITCGHNAYEAHQHREMIEALELLPENIRKQIICVFPMTYPKRDDDYIDRIRQKLETGGLDHVILTDFMDFQDMAEYALISDMMIHVQTTDQLSSTMLEEMYAGSIVIAGKWLPYQTLHDRGIFFLDVDAVSEITEVVKEVVMNMQEYRKKCAGNKEIVWRY